MDKTALFVTVPVLVIAALALAKGIPALRAALHTDALAVLPLGSGATVDIREPGDLILSLRGPLGNRDFARAAFALRDAAGTPAPSRPIAMRAARTGLDGETDLSVRRFTLAAPGRYQLEVTGIDAGNGSAANRLVLSRPRGATLAMPVLWVVSAAVAALAALVFSAVVALAPAAPASSAPPDRATTPAAGSPARAAILDTIRGALAIPATGASRFKVLHLRTADTWAYFEGNEMVRIDGSEWQETDLTARALLQRKGAAWQVRALWSLPTNAVTSLQQFQQQVSELRERDRIPGGIFPRDRE
jgi:hypothetical protein